MSDFFENNQNNINNSPADDTVGEVLENETPEEESTVFSAPVEHKVKAPKASGKKRLISIVAACLAVAVLIGGTIAVVKLIPELKDDEVASSVFEDITVFEKDSSSFTSVTVTNTNGTFKFTSQQIATTDENGKEKVTKYWGTDGVDIKKMSADAMNSVISAASSITATRTINTKTAEECGFNKPIVKVSVDDAKGGAYSFAVGDKSPDGLGYYFMLDGNDTIYVVSTDELADFQFELIDLSDKTAIPATIFTTDTSSNKAADGSYATFDSLTLSGKLFADTITFENNKDSGSSAEIMPYIITTPSQRYSDTEKLTPIIYLFSGSIPVTGNCAFDINDKTLKEFGLDNPDAVVTLTINGENKSFKISKIDDENCAIIYDDATMIRKVAANSFEFLSYKAEDFYSNKPFVYSINDVSVLELVEGENNIKFDISYTDDEEENRTYNILANGTKINAPSFQTFYADFVGLQCNDFKTEQVSGEPESIIKFTFSDGSDTVVEFYKAGETMYQYNIDDIPMGRITSSAYRKMIRSIKDQAK